MYESVFKPDCFSSPDPNVANVQVTRVDLLCDEAPKPITMDLTGTQRFPHVTLLFSSLSYDAAVPSPH